MVLLEKMRDMVTSVVIWGVRAAQYSCGQSGPGIGMGEAAAWPPPARL